MNYWKDRHTDIPLSEYSVAYTNANYIAAQVCPKVSVMKDSDKYYIYGTENIKYYDTLRAPKTVAKGVDSTVSTSSYFCNPHALKMTIDDKDRENADANVDPEIDAVDILMEMMMINYEKEVATLYQTAANYASATYYTTLTGSDQWNDPGYSSKPLDLIEDAKLVVKRGCLKKANSIIIPDNVAVELAKHPDVIDITKYTNPTLLTNGGLPPVLRGLTVYEASAAYDSKREGQSGFTFTDIWTDSVVVFYNDPAASWKSMTFGKTFSRGDTYVKRIDQATLGNNAQDIEINDPGRDPKIITNTAAYLIQDVLA